MRSALIFATLVLIGFLACGTSQVGVAKNEMAESNFDGAKRILIAELEKNPGNTTALLLLGECYLKTDMPDSALVNYQRVLRVAPKNKLARAAVGQIYLIRANRYRDEGDLRLALQSYEEAESYSPNSFDVYYERGLAYQKFSMLARAEGEFQKAAAIAPNDPRIQSRMGEIGAQAGEFEALYAKGLAYYNKRQWDKAIKVLEQAVSLNAAQTDARYMLHLASGRRLYQKGSISALWDAITEFGHASTLKPDSAEPLYYMAQAYEKKDKDDFELIVEAYQKVIKIEPEGALAEKAKKRIDYLVARKEKLEKFWGKKKND